MENIKHYFTRSPIYNDSRWFCLYKDNIGMFISVLNIYTGAASIDMVYPHNLKGTFVQLDDLKINRWEI